MTNSKKNIKKHENAPTKTHKKSTKSGYGEPFFKKSVWETKRGGERKCKGHRQDGNFSLSFSHY